MLLHVVEHMPVSHCTTWSPSLGALDLAVVHTDPTSAPCEATLADTVTPGAPLWASGFPVVTPWGRAVPLRPWLMRGVAATVMRDDDERVVCACCACAFLSTLVQMCGVVHL